MKSLTRVTPLLFAVLTLTHCTGQNSNNEKQKNNHAMTNETQTKNPYYSRTDTTVLKVSDAEWKKVLPEDVYAVAREKDTERAFTGKYWDYEGLGNYY